MKGRESANIVGDRIWGENAEGGKKKRRGNQSGKRWRQWEGVS